LQQALTVTLPGLLFLIRVSHNDIFGLLDSSEYSYYLSGIPGVSICQSSKLSNIQIKVPPNTNTVFTGNVSKKSVYTPCILSCKDYSIFYDPWKFNISFFYKNPNSYMDYRARPIIYVIPAFIGLTGLLLVYWIINWIIHFTLDVKIHYLLTSLFILLFITKIIQYKKYKDEDTYGKQTNSIHNSYIVFDVLSSFNLYFVVLLAAHGWCILGIEIQKKDLIFGTINIVLNVVSNSLLLYVSFQSSFWPFLSAFVLCMSFFGYIYYLSLATQKSMLSVLAHLVAIQEKGIDPTTTPIYNKLMIYNTFKNGLIVYAIVFLLTLVIETFDSITLWLPTATYGLCNIIICYMLAYIFRLKEKKRSGYTIIEEVGETSEYQLQDIKSINANDGFSHDGKTWEEISLFNDQNNASPEKKLNIQVHCSKFYNYFRFETSENPWNFSANPTQLRTLKIFFLSVEF